MSSMSMEKLYNLETEGSKISILSPMNGIPGIFLPGLKNNIFNCSLCLATPFLLRTSLSIPFTIFVSLHTLFEVKKRLAYNEGCLSIPKIREDVMRAEEVTLEYEDETFRTHTKTFNGITARIILHEYDHIEGKLFIDYMSPLKRKLMKRKLDDISKGNISVDYKMTFAKK